MAFEQNSTPDLIGVNRAWYQFPPGQDWTITLGSRVNQSTMLALRPSVYRAGTVLDLFTQTEPSGAYSSNLGAGGGVMWQRDAVSIGWGWNNTRYRKGVDPSRLVAVSQSWTVSVQWDDLFNSATAMRAAIGQPVFATGLFGGESPDDAGYAMEWWTMFPVSDAITVTPAVFFLSRPLGADTPAGQQLNQFGALIKTTLRF